MTLIVDSGYLIALYTPGDSNHHRASMLRLGSGETAFVPDVVLPEVSHVLRRELGYSNSFIFLEFFDSPNVQHLPIQNDDLTRIAEISRQYPRAEFDIVDLCIMAMAERLLITRIATFDARDFIVYRPRHCDYFELLP